MSILRPESIRPLRFWNGQNPTHDACVITTVYNAVDTLESALRSVFKQKVRPGTRIQYIIGFDLCDDGSLQLAQAVCADAPAWMDIELFQNELEPLVIAGRRTGRSNFLNSYSRIRSPVILFCNHDDAWLSDTKLQAQIDHVASTGRSCVTQLKSEADLLVEANREPTVLDPFKYGTSTQISSYAMPYMRPRPGAIWWHSPFLDLPIFCLCWNKFGIDRLLDEETYYRFRGDGSWSGISTKRQKQLIRRMAILQIVFGGTSLRQARDLWTWAQRA